MLKNRILRMENGEIMYEAFRDATDGTAGVVILR